MNHEFDIEANYRLMVEKLVKSIERSKAFRNALKDQMENPAHARRLATTRALVKQANRCISELEFILARNRKALCVWHKEEEPIPVRDGELQIPGCQGCGRMYHTKECPGCGKEFLDWGCKGADDVTAGPYATASGDLYCTYCGPTHDREEEEAMEDECNL